MTQSMILNGLAIACAILAASVAVVTCLWRKAKSEPEKLRVQLAQAHQSEIQLREGFNVRMQEKELAHEKLIRAKEQAFNEALAEKDTVGERLLREKDETYRQMLEEKDASCEKTINEKNNEIERFLKEKEKSFAETVNTLKEQFANLAAQTLKTQSGDLTKANGEQLNLILKPLKDQMEILRSSTEKTEIEHKKLAEAIGKDVGRISDVAKELASVSEALSSNTGFQGRKGEEILAEKLRQAGLEENVNFFLQTGTQSDRPDAQVCDTENRWLIIDSKVVLTSYFQYVEAKDDETRKAKLAEHVSRVREKIDQLARKKYPTVFAEEHKDRNYLPVTAMFVGYEAPLLEALKAEPSLWKRAVDNNVVLVTPLTLMAYLRLVYLAWQHEKEARNQVEIVNTARELLVRLNTFLATFEEMGEALSSAQMKYDDARKVLVDEPHAQTIAKAANKLIDLHVQLEGRKGKRLKRAACLKEVDDVGSQVGIPNAVENAEEVAQIVSAGH